MFLCDETSVFLIESAGVSCPNGLRDGHSVASGSWLFVSVLISHLKVSKRIWEDATLWEGFVRTCKLVATGPASAISLLTPVYQQLPKPQLEELGKLVPELRSSIYLKSENRARTR